MLGGKIKREPEKVVKIYFFIFFSKYISYHKYIANMYVYLAYESYKLHFVCIEFIKKYKKISVSDPLHFDVDPVPDQTRIRP